MNKTADWDMGIGTRQFHGHGVSFDDAQTDDFQLAYYFAVDQCEAAYIVVFELDQSLGLYGGPKHAGCGGLWVVGFRVGVRVQGFCILTRMFLGWRTLASQLTGCKWRRSKFI